MITIAANSCRGKYKPYFLIFTYYFFLFYLLPFPIIAVNEIPRSLLNLVEHPSEIFTYYAQTDKLDASKEEDCHHYRRVARYWLSEEICHHDDVDEIEESNQRHEYSQEANDSQRSRGICHYSVECEVEKCRELPFRLALLALKLLVCYALLPKTYP